MPKLQKITYKECLIVGSSKCSTKLLSQILMRTLTSVKEERQKYCASEVLLQRIQKKPCQSDVDPEKFQRALQLLQA